MCTTSPILKRYYLSNEWISLHLSDYLPSVCFSLALLMWCAACAPYSRAALWLRSDSCMATLDLNSHNIGCDCDRGGGKTKINIENKEKLLFLEEWTTNIHLFYFISIWVKEKLFVWECFFFPRLPCLCLYFLRVLHCM